MPSSRLPYQWSEGATEEDSLAFRKLSQSGKLEYGTRNSPSGVAGRDFSYYRNCALGGAIASSIRWVVTPLEVLKGYRQVNMIPPAVAGVTPGLAFVYRREGVQGLFKGLGPTAAAYSIQTSVKLSMYEYLRDHWSDRVKREGMPPAGKPAGWVCVTAAACAETCASVLMYPFERARVQVQTESLSVRLPQSPSFNFRGLVPLLARQVPGTIVNLYTFENTTQFVYRHVLAQPKDTYSPATQLTVTLASGYVAGMVCAVVSHPADSLLSLLVKHPSSSLRDILARVGLYQLMTRGLAPRVMTLGTIIGGQWYIYDSFKTILGMGTTGG
jgi:solute carrier family 25 (mitochondrial phosphate transporter), member 3